MIIAECKYCRGLWWVGTEADPDTLRGICRECEQEVMVPKFLTFRRLQILPYGWIISS